MKQTILLTGATGFLGKYIIDELKDKNYNIIAIGRNKKIAKEREKKDCKFFIKDFSDKNSIEEIFQTNKIDIVLHCGALSSAWGKWKDFYDANVLGTQNLATLSLKYKVKRFIYISSPSIYTERKDRYNIKENEYNDKNKLNYYIKSKIMSEKILEEINKKGLYTVILRPRGLIGVGDPSLMPRLMNANEKIGIPLFNNGENLVDITCVENVAYACYLAMITDEINGQVFNITNGQPSEFKTLMQKFCDNSDIVPKFRTLPFNFLYIISSLLEFFYKIFQVNKEPTITRYTLCTLAFSQTLNIDNAIKKLNYKPKLTLEEGIKKYGEWWKENKKNKTL